MKKNLKQPVPFEDYKNKKEKKKEQTFNAIKFLASSAISVLLIFSIVKAVARQRPYNPGETLDPDCSIEDENCTVVPPATAGVNFDITSLMSGNIGVGTTTPQSTLHVPNGKYAQFENNTIGVPPANDCNTNAQRGRFSIDTAGDRLYICNGKTRGWDYIKLND